MVTAWMKKGVPGLLLSMLLLLAPAGAFAGDFFITPKVGTQGVGVDLGYELTPHFKTRLNANGMWFAFEGEYSDIDYQVNAQLLTLGLLLDIHPFSGGWEEGIRLTVGVYYNGNRADFNGDVSAGGTYEIGGTNYPGNVVGDIDGNVTWNPFAPYAGIGYGTTADKDQDWFFSFDVGVMYMGPCTVDLNVEDPNNVIPGGDIEREENKVEDDINEYQWYPVISVGVTYRF